uniref:Uncharacterized protein n=1 Tax=Candidatus Kentrum sp. FW TaxID=2126338 RepID=A0A450T665_9GAMM|nr:MAG: hypothetical protein BECKFW1821B_GA0114236_10733 [Candidatus Kentron sp. FW]
MRLQAKWVAAIAASIIAIGTVTNVVVRMVGGNTDHVVIPGNIRNSTVVVGDSRDINSNVGASQKRDTRSISEKHPVTLAAKNTRRIPRKNITINTDLKVMIVDVSLPIGTGSNLMERIAVEKEANELVRAEVVKRFTSERYGISSEAAEILFNKSTIEKLQYKDQYLSITYKIDLPNQVRSK